MPADSPNQDVQKATSTAKGAVQAAKGAKTTIQAVATIAKAGSGPAGWVMLAKQFAPQIKALMSKMRKAAAALAAYILYLLYLLWLKFLGLMAGLAFGAVTGLPLLLIPGAGPFLYGGWVSFWGYRGVTDPLGTIHLATHPWEAVTKPLGYVQDKIFNLGGATKGGIEYVGGGIGHGINVGLSTVGNWITGAASGAWNGAVGMAGNAISWGSSLFSNGLSLLSGTSASASTAGIAQVAVGGAIGTVATATVVAGIVTNSAFFSPEGDLGTINPPGDNPDFTIAKTASPSSIAAPGPDVTFTITLTPKSQAITSVGFIDNFRFSNNGTETPLTVPTPLQCTTPIAVGSTCTTQFKFSTFLIPDDSLLINAVVANATMADGTQKIDSSTVSVPIGAPQTNCPSGWPTGAGSITQGIQGATSHYRSYPTEEAIDIGGATTTDTPTFSTFTGTVIDIIDKDDNNYGIHVDVEGLCNGSRFTTRWAHLDSLDSSLIGKEGSTINTGAPIGKVGSTGLVYGPHLHYSFFGLHMSSPNIPQTPPNTCNDSVTCGVSW